METLLSETLLRRGKIEVAHDIKRRMGVDDL